jgi:hypothetical protein
VRIGPVARSQLARYRAEIRQGQHTLISGATGSGKTELAAELLRAQTDKGAFAVTFVSKLKPDETILRSYRDWTRWKDWKRRPKPYENKILLWPDVDGIPYREAIEIQKNVFRKAFDAVQADGFWSVFFDDALYMCDPELVGMRSDLAVSHAMGRSGKLTLLTATQRPAHLPLILYNSAHHAFIAKTTEDADLKRLSGLDSTVGRKELEPIITKLPEHDFLWVQARATHAPEVINLAR